MIDPAAKLARMANQIALFFRSYPEDQAVAAIREHLAAFWSPRMRRDLEAARERPDLALDPLVAAALAPETVAADGEVRRAAEA